jgi:putative chitinase
MSRKWTDALIACGVKSTTAASWGSVFAAHIPASWGVQQCADFAGQILHESALLSRLEESLNYSTGDRIFAVWPTRFASPDAAAPMVRNPEKLANYVYGGRMGNRLPGDGYRYRGRGCVMVTGRDNYRVIGKAMGVDIESNPDQLTQPETALRASLAWWAANVPDKLAGDCTAITRRVNGGAIGLHERMRLTATVKAALA